MLIKDTETLQKHEYGRQNELDVAQTTAAKLAPVRDARFVADPSTARDNEELQRGTPMSSAELERRLKKLNPAFEFEFVDGNPGMKRLIVPYDGQRCIVCLFHHPVMPEFSVMDTREEEIVDAPLVHYKGDDTMRPYLNRKDISPNNPNPWTRKVKIPWRERTRGWRTVLLICVKWGLLGVEAVEQEFGAADRPSWQHHTGKSSHDIVF